MSDIEEKVDENKVENKKQKSKIKMIIVTIFIVIFSIFLYITLRGSYLEYKELGQNYINVFKTNLGYTAGVFVVVFLFVLITILIVNHGIKKGIQKFFEKENKQMPKLANKSIAFISACILGVVGVFIYTNKVMLFANSTSFGNTDPIFHLDFSYFVFQRPLIVEALKGLIIYTIGVGIYIGLYYIIIFNKYFDGIDKDMLKQSALLKSVKHVIILISVLLCLFTIVSVQSMEYGTITKTKDDYALVGAGSTDAIIKLYGYLIFAFVILVCVIKCANIIGQGKIRNIIKPLLVIPAYLVVLFLVMMLYDFIFVNNKQLDVQGKYISENIKNTRDSYSIKLEETQLDYSGTINSEQIEENEETIDNIAIVSSSQVIQSLTDTQSEKGYFEYLQATLEEYIINSKKTLLYVAPRTIKSSGRTYQNTLYEYTHGYGLILVDAASTMQDGRIKYIQKSFDGSDNVINIDKYQTYYSNQQNNVSITNTKTKQEYDYTDDQGNDIVSMYSGTSGLSLNILDRLILAIKKLEPAILFSNQYTSSSKILINQNIVQRAKKVLPDLIYDLEPYAVIDDSGNIIYVLDCYTYTGNIPYSQYTTIERNNRKTRINYIKNSIKVLVDSYDGTMKFYITDRDDPIAMAYYNMYPELFVDKEEQIPEDISEHFVYPKYLYDIQANMLNVYHSLKSDIIYRADDLWEIAKTGVSKSSKQLESTYTMVSPAGEEATLGLVQLFTPYEKRNIISYLVGTTSGATNELKLYTFTQDDNVIGPAQLELQLSQDEQIEKQLENLSVTGTKITNNFIAVPIDDTILYVKAVYQNFLNEKDSPILKKVIVASGNKIAIGDSLKEAIENLSTSATDIEVVNSDSVQALIDAIINANENLTQSASDNNYELFGKDLQKLQDLINQLDTLQKQEEKANKDETENSEEEEETNEEAQQTQNSYELE